MPQAPVNVERWIYMTAFEDLATKASLSLALELRAQWSTNSKGKNMAAAACHYMTYYVIPALGGDRNNNPTPRWVMETLLDPPTTPTDVPSFLRLFDSNYVECLNERERGPGRVLGHPGAPGTPSTEELRDLNMGVFFTPNPIDGEKLSEKGSRRLDENVQRFSACFADFDGGDKMTQMATIDMFCPPPGIIVESKNGYHTYWHLDGDISLQEWRNLQEGIIKRCGSDKAVKNPSRLMRLPFTWHCKTDDKFLVRIARFKWKRYTKQELAEAFSVELNPQLKAMRTGYTGPQIPRGLRVPDLRILTPNDRHPTLQTEAARIYARLPREMAQSAREIITMWYERSCSPLKKDWRKEVSDVIRWVETREYGCEVSQDL